MVKRVNTTYGNYVRVTNELQAVYDVDFTDYQVGVRRRSRLDVDDLPLPFPFQGHYGLAGEAAG